MGPAESGCCVRQCRELFTMKAVEKVGVSMARGAGTGQTK